MRRSTLVILIGATTIISGRASTAQRSPADEAILQRLGPDPFTTLPQSLASLVKSTPAAVIAEMVGPGRLQLRTLPTSRGAFARGFAGYRIIVRDVLYNRLGEQGPPLVVDSEVDLLQLVGRDSAEAFVARRLPVAPGDRCLLFLWHEQGSDIWQMLRWPAHFKQSDTFADAAETLAPWKKEGLDAEWLGPSLALAVIPAGHTVMPQWNALVQEVRRLSK